MANINIEDLNSNPFTNSESFAQDLSDSELNAQGGLSNVTFTLKIAGVTLTIRLF
jgi:hypothetical protein